MKKSNIIVIIFATLVVTSVLVFFIDGKKHKKTESNATFETIQLPDFSVVVAEENADVHIIQSDTVQLKIEVLKDSVKKQNLYTIANDTLHIYKGSRIFVSNKNIVSIIAQNAKWVGVQFEKCDSLNIKVFNTEKLSIGIDSKNCNISKLKLNGKTTDNIYLNEGLVIDDLNINLTKSRMTIWGGKYKTSSIVITDSSHLQISASQSVENLTLKKDNTCSLNSYN